MERLESETLKPLGQAARPRKVSQALTCLSGNKKEFSYALVGGLQEREVCVCRYNIYGVSVRTWQRIMCLASLSKALFLPSPLWHYTDLLDPSVSPFGVSINFS